MISGLTVAGAIASESMSMSAKTGFAPTRSTHDADAMKLLGVTMTSSPGPIPHARRIASRASEPLANADRKRHLVQLGEGSLEQADLLAGPLVDLAGAQRLDDRRDLVGSIFRPRRRRRDPDRGTAVDGKPFMCCGYRSRRHCGPNVTRIAVPVNLPNEAENGTDETDWACASHTFDSYDDPTGRIEIITLASDRGRWWRRRQICQPRRSRGVASGAVCKARCASPKAHRADLAGIPPQLAEASDL